MWRGCRKCSEERSFTRRVERGSRLVEQERGRRASVQGRPSSRRAGYAPAAPAAPASAPTHATLCVINQMVNMADSLKNLNKSMQ